ncbi:hypothetical protein BGZ46_001139 [Entomortierella lignicola]|nr:hypothetical protein BGZ46_001139 [Entomortierella lignicola]
MAAASGSLSDGGHDYGGRVHDGRVHDGCVRGGRVRGGRVRGGRVRGDRVHDDRVHDGRARSGRAYDVHGHADRVHAHAHAHDDRDCARVRVRVRDDHGRDVYELDREPVLVPIHGRGHGCGLDGYHEDYGRWHSRGCDCGHGVRAHVRACLDQSGYRWNGYEVASHGNVDGDDVHVALLLHHGFH